MADRHDPHQDHHVVGTFDRELNYRVLFWFMAVITVITVGAFVGMWYMGIGFKDRMAAQDPPVSPLLEDPDRLVPPGPSLQVESYTDWAEMLEAHREHLSTYAWTNREKGKVRIPIEEAMRRVAENGLPEFPTPPPTEPVPTDAPAGNR